MSKGKTRLGLVGLCATAAMALMAFGASGAQAASWLVGGATVAANLTVELKIAGDTLTKLLSKAIGLTISIDCTVYEAKNFVLKASGVATGEVWFKNCETYIVEDGKEVLHGECRPTEPIKAGGILTAVTVGSATEIKVTPVSGSFVTIEFPNEEECLLPATEVKGTLWLKDCKGQALVDQLTHLVEEDMAQALSPGPGLKFGLEPALIDGSVNLALNDGGAKTFAFHG